MGHRIAILILGALVVCGLLSGCGGGGSSDSLSKADFAKQANEVCKRASGKISADIVAMTKSGAASGASPAQTKVIYVKKVLVPGLEAELQELRALGAPKGNAQGLQAFFKASQQMIDKAKNDPSGFAEAPSPYEGMELAGRRYGVTDCPIVELSA